MHSFSYIRDLKSLLYFFFFFLVWYTYLYIFRLQNICQYCVSENNIWNNLYLWIKILNCGHQSGFDNFERIGIHLYNFMCILPTFSPFSYCHGPKMAPPLMLNNSHGLWLYFHTYDLPIQKRKSHKRERKKKKIIFRLSLYIYIYMSSSSILQQYSNPIHIMFNNMCARV